MALIINYILIESTPAVSIIGTALVGSEKAYCKALVDHEIHFAELDSEADYIHSAKLAILDTVAISHFLIGLLFRKSCLYILPFAV